MGTLLKITGGILLACLTHELGHYLTARLFKARLTFRFSWGKLFGKIPVPRFTWDMPEGLTDRQKKIVALSGFGLELLAAPLLFAAGIEIYTEVALAHLALYPLYAGEANDFKWLNM